MTKVLVVEDDPILLSAYQTKLTREGIEVETAVDGEEALKKASANEPDLILLDLLMPKMSGIEFLRQYDVRSKHPDVKVVVFSNLATVDAPKQAFALGAVKFLPKATSTPNYIVKVIKEVLKLDNSSEKQ